MRDLELSSFRSEYLYHKREAEYYRSLITETPSADYSLMPGTIRFWSVREETHKKICLMIASYLNVDGRSAE